MGVYREEVWRQIEDEEKDLSPAARRARAKEDQATSNPFFITVFHPGEPSHAFDEDD